MEQPKKIDLHAHSTASDGTLSPSELIKEAKPRRHCAHRPRHRRRHCRSENRRGIF